MSRLGIWILSSRAESISHSFAILSALEDKIRIPARPCNILYLLYAKLREQARWGELCVLIGYPSGQDRPILSARDCPFCSRNKISPKSKQVHESFLLQNIFSVEVKRFSVIFFVGMELENEKTESVNKNENKENKT